MEFPIEQIEYAAETAMEHAAPCVADAAVHPSSGSGAAAHRKRAPEGTLLHSMEPTSGFEPLTHALRVRCSTS